MSAPETLIVPFAALRERPKSCPEHVWAAFAEMRSERRSWSWFWYRCALDVYRRNGFGAERMVPEPMEPVSGEAEDPATWGRYEAAVRANAERYLDLERFRVALEDHDPHGDAICACRSALDTFRGWGPTHSMRATFNADLRQIQRRDPCRHGFQVRWAGDECPEGCR